MRSVHLVYASSPLMAAASDTVRLLTSSIPGMGFISPTSSLASGIFKFPYPRMTTFIFLSPVSLRYKGFGVGIIEPCNRVVLSHKLGNCIWFCLLSHPLDRDFHPRL